VLAAVAFAAVAFAAAGVDFARVLTARDARTARGARAVHARGA
jgi:hypothetical protein